MLVPWLIMAGAFPTILLNHSKNCIQLLVIWSKLPTFLSEYLNHAEEWGPAPHTSSGTLCFQDKAESHSVTLPLQPTGDLNPNLHIDSVICLPDYTMQAIALPVGIEPNISTLKGLCPNL